MKTRNDYVSNSSSCSFIVSVDFGKYPFEEFVEQVCRTCCPEGAVGKTEAASVRRANEAVLRAGMYQECLYLGIPVAGRIREEWRRGEDWDHSPCEDGEFTPFNMFMHCHPQSREKIELKGDVVVHEYDEDLPAWMSVPRETMTCGIRHYYQCAKLPRELQKNSAKARAGRIIAYVRQKQNEAVPRREPEVFRITKNTVENTRDLAKAGYRVNLFSSLPASDALLNDALDAIEARISAGETFIYAVASDPGEGRDYGRLYMPDGYSNPFARTPAQRVDGLVYKS